MYSSGAYSAAVTTNRDLRKAGLTGFHIYALAELAALANTSVWLHGVQSCSRTGPITLLMEPGLDVLICPLPKLATAGSGQLPWSACKLTIVSLDDYFHMQCAYGSSTHLLFLYTTCVCCVVATEHCWGRGSAYACLACLYACRLEYVQCSSVSGACHASCVLCTACFCALKCIGNTVVLHTE